MSNDTGEATDEEELMSVVSSDAGDAGEATDAEELMPGVSCKKIIRCSGESPEFKQWVNFSWTGNISGGTVFAPKRSGWAKIGDGDVCPGLELALRSMHLGETAIVRCSSRFAFGIAGRRVVREGDVLLPPETDVEFEVELTEFGAAPGAESPVDDALRKRSIGNEHFEYYEFEKAARCYGAAIKSVDGVTAEVVPDDLIATVNELLINCGNNLAQCYLKLNEFAKAESAAIAVLTLEPSNLKALYRGGISAMRQDRFDESRKAFDKLMSLDPQNSAGLTRLDELNRLEKAYKLKEHKMMKEMSKGIFGSAKKVEPKVEEKSPGSSPGGATVEPPREAGPERIDQEVPPEAMVTSSPTHRRDWAVVASVIVAVAAAVLFFIVQRAA